MENKINNDLEQRFGDLHKKLDNNEISIEEALKMLGKLKRELNVQIVNIMLNLDLTSESRKVELREKLRILSFDTETVTNLYFKHCEMNGVNPKQPSDNESYAGKKYFYLKNSRRNIAKFNMIDETFV